jgi:hypothetical protein
VAIQAEVASYSELMKKMGASIPLIFDEDEEITLKSSSITILLQEALSGSLSNVHLAYICDCLTLGQKIDYADEKLQDTIFTIADPEINGGYKTHLELKTLIEGLNKTD